MFFLCTSMKAKLLWGISPLRLLDFDTPSTSMENTVMPLPTTNLNWVLKLLTLFNLHVSKLCKLGRPGFFSHHLDLHARRGHKSFVPILNFYSLALCSLTLGSVNFTRLLP